MFLFQQTPKKLPDVSIFGRMYTVEIVPVTSKIGITISGETLQIRQLSPNLTRAKQQLQQFLKGTAEKYITPRTHELAKKMTITFNRLSYKAQKTRWGSCSSLGNINFNWRLIYFTPEVIDYVIIHELAHRQHMNHSDAFWNVVKIYDPEYRKHRGTLKRARHPDLD